MRTIAIADVHQNIAPVEKILKREKAADNFIFLGDWFDKFPTQPGVSHVETAEFLKSILYDKDKAFLWGNHDLGYRYQKAGIVCSGWTLSKTVDIGEVLLKDDWGQFQLFALFDEVLYTHAGLNNELVPEDLMSDEIDKLGVWLTKMALEIFDDFDSRDFSRELIPVLLAPGWERGGWQPQGGVTWNDWHTHVPVPGVSQIFGHTPGTEPRLIEHEKNEDWCIDTAMRHYAVVEDGEIEIVEV